MKTARNVSAGARKSKTATGTRGGKSKAVKATAAVPDDASITASIISDPRVLVECNPGLKGYVSLTNDGVAPVVVTLWTRDDGRPGLPEGGLLVAVPVLKGHTLTYSADDVIRIQFDAAGRPADRRYWFRLYFEAANASSAPPRFTVNSTRAGSFEISVTASGVAGWNTDVVVEATGQPRYKTKIDAGVNATVYRNGATATTRCQDGTGPTPFRRVTFNS